MLLRYYFIIIFPVISYKKFVATYVRELLCNFDYLNNIKAFLNFCYSI